MNRHCTKELRIIADTPPEQLTVEPPSILTKAFDLLHAFNHKDRVMTLTELAQAAQLPKSTVHRLLARLIELDAVEHHGAGYKLSLRLLQLGATTPAASLRDRALPHLAGLHRWTGETVQLGVLRQFDVVYLEKLARSNSPVVLSRVGGRLPANCTAIGKALLAWEDLDDLAALLPSPMPMLTPHSVSDVNALITELHEIKGSELARERNEAQPGLSCVATPIVVQGIAVAAVSVCYRSDTPFPPRVDTALRNTATQISREVREALGRDYRPEWRHK